MKSTNRLSLVCICIAVLTAVQCKNSDSNENSEEKEQFKISGKIKNQPDGMIYLEELDVPEGASSLVDSVQLQNDQFTFSGKVDFPKWYAIKTSDTTEWPLRIVLSNEDITINAVKDSLYKGPDNVVN